MGYYIIKYTGYDLVKANSQEEVERIADEKYHDLDIEICPKEIEPKYKPGFTSEDLKGNLWAFYDWDV